MPKNLLVQISVATTDDERKEKPKIMAGKNSTVFFVPSKDKALSQNVKFPFGNVMFKRRYVINFQVQLSNRFSG